MQLALDITHQGCRVIAGLTDALADERRFAEALERVSASRRQKVQSYRFAKDRRLSLLAGLLLDELLGDVGLCERDMAYAQGEGGKPVFANRPDLHFSLAHAERMAVAALSGAPVGVDVEYLPTFPHDVAEPYAWTEMESVGKLYGSGVGAFVDGEAYSRPAGVTLEHIPLGDYLVCIASLTSGAC